MNGANCDDSIFNSLSLSLSLSNEKEKRCILGEERGGVSIVLALLLVPLITLTLAAVLTTRHLSVWTRTHQAQTAAVLAVTKEGEDASGEDRTLMVQAWLNENFKALKLSDVWTPFLSGTQDTERLDVAWSPGAVLDKFMSSISQNPVTDTVQAERFYRPIEAVLVLDASVSMGYDLMHEVALAVTDKLFRGKEVADDVRMGLLAYGSYVNIGSEFADKIITPESRRLAKPGTELGKNKTQEMYEAQVATLKEYNPGLVDDLLATGGPGSDWEAACVARPLAAPGSNPTAYKQTVEEPPAESSEGFTLLMSDGRTIKQNGGSTTDISTLMPFEYGYMLSAPYMSDTPVYNEDILKLGLAPQRVVVDSERHNFSKYSKWGGGNNWSAIRNEVVMWYHDCSVMPMLVGASSVGDVMDRIDMYKTAWTTGADEGLAWALRQFSPSWSSIWEKGDNFPAPYHSITEKRLLMILGHSTTANRDANPPRCEMIRDNGIDAYLVNIESITGDEEDSYNICSKNGNMVKVDSNEELVETLRQFATRHYRVRLVESD